MKPAVDIERILRDEITADIAREPDPYMVLVLAAGRAALRGYGVDSDAMFGVASRVTIDIPDGDYLTVRVRNGQAMMD